MITKFDPAPIVCVTHSRRELNIICSFFKHTLIAYNYTTIKSSGGSVGDLTENCILVSEYFLLEEKVGLAHCKKTSLCCKG